LVAGYYPGSELQKTNERPGKDRAQAMVAIAEALMPDYDAVSLAQDLSFFVPRYDPIWAGSSLYQPALDRVTTRIKQLKVNRTAVDEWKIALTKLQGGDVNLFWTFGIVVDIPRLFSATGFGSGESQRLLARLSKLPPSAAESLASTLNSAKARAAGNLVQQDWLFPAEEWDPKRFSVSLERLAKAIASRGATPARGVAPVARESRATVAPVGEPHFAILFLDKRDGTTVDLRIIAVPTQAQADQVLDRLRRGEAFAKVADQVSVQPTRPAGGYLGRFELSDLRDDFKSALANVPVSGYTRVIQLK
jgi:hypothetical protein